MFDSIKRHFHRHGDLYAVPPIAFVTVFAVCVLALVVPAAICGVPVMALIQVSAAVAWVLSLLVTAAVVAEELS